MGKISKVFLKRQDCITYFFFVLGSYGLAWHRLTDNKCSRSWKNNNHACFLILEFCMRWAVVIKESFLKTYCINVVASNNLHSTLLPVKSLILIKDILTSSKVINLLFSSMLLAKWVILRDIIFFAGDWCLMLLAICSISFTPHKRREICPNPPVGFFPVFTAWTVTVGMGLTFSVRRQCTHEGMSSRAPRFGKWLGTWKPVGSW